MITPKKVWVLIITPGGLPEGQGRTLTLEAVGISRWVGMRMNMSRTAGYKFDTSKHDLVVNVVSFNSNSKVVTQNLLGVVYKMPYLSSSSVKRCMPSLVDRRGFDTPCGASP